MTKLTLGEDPIKKWCFIKYDHGYNYYNVHFWRKLCRIQVGIAADPFQILKVIGRNLQSFRKNHGPLDFVFILSQP